MSDIERPDEPASRLDTLIEALPDAVFFKDGEGRWRVVNSAGLRLFRLGAVDWPGRTGLELATVQPHLAQLLRACHASDEVAWSGGRRISLNETVVDPDSGRLLTFEITKVPLFHADGRRRGLVVVGRDITERRRLEANELRHRTYLRQLSEIAALSHLPLAEQLQQALALGAAHLGVEFGIVSHIEGDHYHVVSQVSPPDTLQDGQVFPLGQTYCSLTLARDDVLAIEYMGHSPHLGHPCYQAFRLETYIGAPLRVDGQVYGTVNFSSPRPYHRPFDDGDREFVHLLSRWAQSAIERERMEHRLRESELQLQAIIENEPECVKILSEDGRLLKMNRAGLAMIEADSMAEVLGRSVLGLVKPEHREPFQALVRQVFAGTPGRLEFEMCGLKGTPRWLETNAVPLTDPAGRIVSLLSVTRDVSEHRQAEAALRDSERRFRDTLEHAPIGMAVTAPDGRITLANNALCRILGYDKAELAAMAFRDYVHPDDLPRTLADRERLLAGEIESYHGEKRYLHRNGQTVWVQVTVSALRDAGGRPLNVIAQIEDVSERKRDREQIHHLAYYDTLTNLPNRRLLTDRFNQALAQARRHGRSLAVMFLDLDGFKEVNDRHGHDVGDELLKEVAARLRLCVRSGDTVARQGGDEFIVLLSEIGRQQDAERVAGKILAALAAPVTVGAHCLQVTTSIGIAVLAAGGVESVTELMKRADMAMYAAKAAGRNGYRICTCPPGFASERCVSIG